MHKVSFQTPSSKSNSITQSVIDRYLNQSQPKQLELSLGNNLYLFVTKIGSCIFKYRCNFKGRLTWITLGSYSGKNKAGKIIGLSLEDSKIKALTMNQLIKNGINPKEEFERDKIKAMTIAELAEKYFIEQLPSRRPNTDSSNQFIYAVRMDIVSKIGNYAVVDVDDDLIRAKIIHPQINKGSLSIAKRSRTNLKILLDYAIEEHKIIKYNPASLIKAERIYQDRPRQRYLTMNELGILLNTLYSAPLISTQYKIAIHLLIILLARKLELQHATWNQVDFNNKTFTIVDSKMGTDLLIKLPKQAVKLFEIQKTLSGSNNYIFPGRFLIKPMSPDLLNGILRDLLKNHIEDFVVHDFRRTGATNLGELGYPMEVIESALNHTKRGIQKVYHRTQYIEQREKMLADWANRIDSLIKPELLPYGKYFPI